jgi:small subunit ribosomal protein S15
MTKKIINKEKIFKDLKNHSKDVGSSEVQIGILTERIRYLTEHFAKNKKDKHSYTGLSKLVNRRKKLLDYLSKNNTANYKKILEKLNIRK